MRKMEKERICEKAQKELMTIMEGKELTSNGVENASKLVDIIKDIKNMEYWDVKCEYYDAILGEMRGGGYSNEGNGGYSREGRGNGGNGGNYSNDYDNGNSYGRGRSERTGRYVHRPNNYSRLAGDDTDMDEYRKRKSEYSNSRDEGSKGRMLDALEDFMCGVQGMLKQIYRDSDTGEEREIIRKYARQIAEM